VKSAGPGEQARLGALFFFFFFFFFFMR